MTMVAPDAHRAKEFYEAVLRVPFSPVTPARGAPTRPGRRWASVAEGAEPGVQLSYRVDDIAAAVERSGWRAAAR